MIFISIFFKIRDQILFISLSDCKNISIRHEKSQENMRQTGWNVIDYGLWMVIDERAIEIAQ